MKFFLSGDTHGDFTRFYNFEYINDPNVAIIILGDDGCNFFGGNKDKRVKDEVAKFNCRFYMVRGNHAMRPADVKTMDRMYDPEVAGMVYYEPEYMNIRYFNEYGIYKINDKTCGVIGGAYSVDKEYRLSQGWTWHANEQLSKEELVDCSKLFINYKDKIDFMFTHTCPYDWRPTDMFLPMIEQSSVDNTMEKYLMELRDSINWGTWLWGHFHTDRVEAPHAEIMYNNIQSFDDIIERWDKYDKTGELDWWIKKGPKFYYDTSIS